MNYTNNINCHQMKPLERKFFKYVCKQIDYDNINMRDRISFIKPFGFLMGEFADKYGIPIKMIDGWVKKWHKYGFYNYAVIPIYGWFEYTDALILNIPTKKKIGFKGNACWDKYINEDIKQYINIVPERVRRQYKHALEKNKRGE